MTIQAVALDLDGTLVKTGVLEISAEDRAAIRNLVDAGIHIVLATARTPAQARQFQAELGISGPVIGNNGALAEVGDGVEILHRRIDGVCAERIVAALLDAGLYPNVIRGNEIIRRRRPEEPLGRQVTRVRFVEYAADLVDDLLSHVRGGATQIGIFARSLDSVLTSIASEPVCMLRYYDAEALSGAIFVHPSASKGDALQTVLGHLRVDAANVLAIGDSEADLSMFQVAGRAVAVANATPSVRAAAHWVAPAQWEGGVAAAIRRFV